MCHYIHHKSMLLAQAALQISSYRAFILKQKPQICAICVCMYVCVCIYIYIYKKLHHLKSSATHHSKASTTVKISQGILWHKAKVICTTVVVAEVIQCHYLTACWYNNVKFTKYGWVSFWQCHGKIFITHTQFQHQINDVNTSRVWHATEPIFQPCYEAL